MEYGSGHWVHFEYTINRENQHDFVLNFLHKFPGISYFDRINQNDDFIKLQLHIKCENKPTFNAVTLFRETFNLTEISDYHIDSELSELFFGEKSAEFFLSASLASMELVNFLVRSFREGSISVADTSFKMMSLYVLHPECKKIFLSAQGDEAVPLSFLSFRSHSDGYFIRMGQEEVYRSTVESLYQKNSKKYQDCFKKISREYQGDELPAEMKLWVRLLDYLFDEAQHSLKNNGVKFYEKHSGYIGNSNAVSHENFHFKTKNMRVFYRYIRANKRMKVLRLVTGFMYLTLHRMGLGYVERNCFCYIISRVVEDVYNTNIDSSIQSLNKLILNYYLKRALKLNFSA